ncbi:MAG: hypothetical protein LBO71_07525 [Prevotellaceae bacterium]|nr:hypothetical protein [Prevotellaceae bacterium]
MSSLWSLEEAAPNVAELCGDIFLPKISLKKEAAKTSFLPHLNTITTFNHKSSLTISPFL